ncbi:MAG: hypothetical protein JNK85_11665 [Verrucomicrobiales bacterium]|nr:hypothetical protein [Verrucomicrobiales bacterium]
MNPRSIVAVSVWVGLGCLAIGAMDGPLRLSYDNPRYFTDRSGKAIYLAGAHTWNNLVDMGPTDPPTAFGYEKFLDLLESHHHNVFRLWAWHHFESTWELSHRIAPLPWVRTGPGEALDGKPRFDLTAFDPAYFDRLRERVRAAQDRGIYVSVMLFEGWGLQFNPQPWRGHPFHASNNINGINGDPNGSGKGLEIQSWELPPGVWEIEKAYVRKVVDTVNDFDNVLYEVVNEAGPYSTQWQYQVIHFVRVYESEKPKRHPIGMTFQHEGGSNQDLFNSPADWISPNPAGGYREDPPVASGAKVILNDTDHLWGIGGNRAWVWKSFCRGLNVLFMDPYDDIKEGGGIYTTGNVVKHKLTPALLNEIRAALGHTRQWADRLPLKRMTPQSNLASSGYCLANLQRGAEEFLIYAPPGPAVSVDLSNVQGVVDVEWFDPGTGESRRVAEVSGGLRRELAAPFAGDAVLHLKRKAEERKP